MTTYAKHLGEKSVPQTEPLDDRQVQNNQGGFVYPVDDMKRLERFLILGSEGGTYYSTERKLTLESAACVSRMVMYDGQGLDAVALITEVSAYGRAPKNEPALMALAVAAKMGTTVVRQAAMRSLPVVARTGTHLFHFVEYCKQLGANGRVVKTGVRRWYTGMSPDRLATQVTKYQSRDGWSHRDVLRKFKPRGRDTSATHDAVLYWAVNGWKEIGEHPHPDPVLRRIWAFERAKQLSGKELVRLISDYDLPRECVPSEALNDPAVWEAMLPHMGVTALVRNLGKMTSVGLLKPLSAAVRDVCARLGDAEELRRGRVHPVQMLSALRVYQQGHGEKGSLSWKPVHEILGALEDGFYAAFKNVEPTGKRHLLAVDVSGSMGWTNTAGVPGLTCREGAAVMAMVLARTEARSHVVGFCHKLTPLGITPRMTLSEAVDAVTRAEFGGTDCTAPIAYALREKLDVDAFVVITDNETAHGSVHPMAALRDYRRRTGIPAKLAVMAMTATEFSIADPEDGGAMDMVGFDAAAPAVLADFVRS